MGYKAVRNEHYKYIRYVELKGMDELYDLREDPYELHNLIDVPSYANILDQMKMELEKQLKET